MSFSSNGNPLLGFYVLGSGSAGNALLVTSAKTRVLIDCGFSGVELARRMQTACAGAPEAIDALVVTHGHGDHTHGVPVVSSRYDIPLYMTPGTKRWYGNRKRSDLTTFTPGESFSVGDLTFSAIGLEHDAPDTVALRVACGDESMAVCTDLGRVTPEVEQGLSGCGFLFLESNHDVAMLENGPYPARLKKRIRGPYGHISNDETADLLGRLIPTGTRRVVLAHLSETNNTPQTALRTMAPLKARHPAVEWSVAPQHAPAVYAWGRTPTPTIMNAQRQLELL